jgi:opacity protein-like surface antigen
MRRILGLTCLGFLSLFAQVGVWGTWGGNTSINDLTAAGEGWTRFYAAYGIGVRFLPERRFQPFLVWQGGSLVSQNRDMGLYARTSWNAIGLGLRGHLRKGLWSPFLQLSAHRFSFSVRGQDNKPPAGVSPSLAALGLSWGAGLRISVTEGVAFGLLYQRLRPQTNLLEGFPGPKKDRIEAIMGELLFYFPEQGGNTRSRF